MSLDKDTVRKIAFLARIRVPPEALDGLAAELSNIIGWVEQLDEVETASTAPMTSVADITLPRREDVVTDVIAPRKCWPTHRNPRPKAVAVISWCPRWWNERA